MRKEILIMALIIVAVIIAAYLGSNYYRSSVQKERKPASSPNAALVREDSPTLGAPDAKITLVEFYDPECESCAAFSQVVKKILKDYDGRIRLVARYMPLHPNSINAAIFNEAASEQGKYWEARELLFQKQPEWGEKHGQPASAPKPDIPALFKKYASELGLDTEKVTLALNERRFMAKIERDKRDGQTLGVRKTPTFFVNGRELARFGEADLRKLIDEELKN